MANIKSQKKRNLTNEKARIRNKQLKSQIKTAIKKYKLSLNNQNNKENNNDNLKNNVISLIDKSFTKGIYHKNKVNRMKSKIMTLSAK